MAIPMEAMGSFDPNDSSSDEIRALHDKLIRSYLFTLNKDGPTESNLSAAEVDLILLALKTTLQRNS